MKTYAELEDENKNLRQRLRKVQRDRRLLQESADRFVLYTVGAHNAKALGLTNVKPMIIKAGNKRIYPV